jgi:hypothetical protein
MITTIVSYIAFGIIAIGVCSSFCISNVLEHRALNRQFEETSREIQETTRRSSLNMRVEPMNPIETIGNIRPSTTVCDNIKDFCK